MNVLISRGEEVHDVAFKCFNPVSWSQIPLEACQLPTPTDSDYNYRSRPATTSVTPSVTYMGDAEIRGFKMALFEVYPFSYNAATGSLTAYQDLTLVIRLGTAQGQGNMQPPANSTAWACDTTRKWLREMVCNYTDVGTLYPNFNNDTLPANKRFQYLIITNNALKAEFQRLSDWKNTKGVRTKVLTTEEIYQNYPDTTQQRQIKRAIMAFMDSTQGALRYVLLGGDESVVPVQMAYLKLIASDGNGGTKLYEKTTPSDLYYASRDLNWDANCNGVPCELEDSITINSNLSVSRIPVVSSDAASMFVNKIINYERAPNIDTWTESILMAGNELYPRSSTYVNGEKVSDAQMYGEELYNRYIKAFWNGERVRFYDTATDLAGGKNYDFTIENLQTELAKGYTFAYILTHGTAYNWKMEQPYTYYSTTHASQLNNTGSTVIVAGSCLTSAFDSTATCLAEAFLLNPNSGINTFIASSRENWSGAAFWGYYFRSLFSGQGHHLASALSKTKNFVAALATRYTTDRWLALSVNALGDAEMPVYTSCPNTFDNLFFNYHNGSLIINHNVDSCATCVMSQNDVGNSYYQVISNTDNTCSSFEYLTSPEPYSLCVTRNGFIPFSAVVSQNYKLQNDSIQQGDSRYVICEEAKIGKQVTNNKPQGEVIIQGNMTIQYNESVIIDKGTIIDMGSSFKIIKN